MKRLLLISTLLLSTATLFAQKIEIGVNGGFSFNSTPLDNSADIYFYNGHRTAANASPTGSVEVMYNYHKWQAGVSLGFLKMSYNESGIINTPFMEMSAVYGTYTFVVGNPVIPIDLFANRILINKKIKVFAGLHAGYAGAIMASPENTDGVWGKPKTYDTHGYDLGLQAGASYYFSKHFGICGQVKASNLFINTHFGKDFLYVATTLGLRYRL